MVRGADRAASLGHFSHQPIIRAYCAAFAKVADNVTRRPETLAAIRPE